ncbi:MAG: hypothetical protein LUH45_00530, partial [Clostridiales bacterium]|nr:hypothetical protein [Clostridiales bacterium]
ASLAQSSPAEASRGRARAGENGAVSRKSLWKTEILHRFSTKLSTISNFFPSSQQNFPQSYEQFLNRVFHIERYTAIRSLRTA